MKPRVLVLGATYNQVPLVKKIQEMGYEAWVAAAGDMSACQEIADELFDINTQDTQSILNLVTNGEVRGLVTCGTSTPIITAAAVNERFCGSPFVIPLQVAKNATFKDSFRAILEPYGLVPPGFSCGSMQEIRDRAPTLSLPLVLKPVDSGGGKGVRVLTEPGDQALYEAASHAMAHSVLGRVIVEEYIDGLTLGVESITLDNQTFTLAIPEKTLTGFPHCVTTGVIFPSPALAPHRRHIEETNTIALQALGVEWGPAHVDMVLRKDGRLFVIDVGPRLAGGPLASTLIPSATGYDLYAAVIRLAIGELPPAPFVPPVEGYWGSHFITRNVTGKIKRIQFDHSVKQLPGLRGFRLLKTTGNELSGLGSDNSRLAVCHYNVENLVIRKHLIAAVEERFAIDIV